MFEYPIDGETLLRKYRSIRRELMGGCQGDWLDKRIAILGGSTTAEVRKMLELFLLYHGIRPVFYESEYGAYWRDAMFGNDALAAFAPDVIYIHTTVRDIERFPEVGAAGGAGGAGEPTPGKGGLLAGEAHPDGAGTAEVADASKCPGGAVADVSKCSGGTGAGAASAEDALLAQEFGRFRGMWEKLAADYHCPIIQNNFEYPDVRLLGNADAYMQGGRVRFVSRLNLMFADYAATHGGLYINDINWLSADYGLGRWADPFYWHMYKYAMALPAIPHLAQSVARIVKSLYGKNKKVLALDLDNTLWGGVVGDDGPENLEMGQETSAGQAFAAMQSYVKAHPKLGVVLGVISKNDEENALAGLRRPDSALAPEDFASIKANWQPKSQNLVEMADELGLLPDSFVFVDDNPAEREIVRRQVPGAAVPDMGQPELYIRALDRNGYFEVTGLSADDLARGDMYRENARRKQAETAFADYHAYLESLEMAAEIAPFAPMYMSRIAQLTNKSNQFNLTTRRYSQEEIEAMAGDGRYITLYGKLTDRFGDNGVVSVVAGEVVGETLHIRLWLMSCRVLKRSMEHAMMDELVRRAQARGVTRIAGYYYPTAKNGMVRDFYGGMGFERVSGGATDALADGEAAGGAGGVSGQAESASGQAESASGQPENAGGTVWELDIGRGYEVKQDVIKIVCGGKPVTDEAGGS